MHILQVFANAHSLSDICVCTKDLMYAQVLEEQGHHSCIKAPSRKIPDYPEFASVPKCARPRFAVALHFSSALHLVDSKLKYDLPLDLLLYPEL